MSINTFIHRSMGYAFRAFGNIWLALFFPAALLVVTLYALATGRALYFYEMNTQHLGGWALTLDAFLRRLNTGIIPQGVHLFLVKRPRVSNPYFYELMKRRVLVIDNFFGYWLLLPLATWKNKFRGKQLTYLAHSECYPPLQWFDDNEVAKGKKLLGDFGLTDNDWYACFFARDDGYIRKTSRRSEMSSYLDLHNCRNADIAAYEEGMKYVAKEGGFVFRVGKHALKRLSLDDPKIIDYPFCELHSDFLDIFLVCHARFIVGTGSGVVDLSSIMDVPLAVTDHMYYDCPYGMYARGRTRRPLIYIPKLLKYISNGRNLTLDEYSEFVSLLSMPPYQMRPFLKGLSILGVQYENNSPEDILLITKKIFWISATHTYLTSSNKECINVKSNIDGRYDQMLPEFMAKYNLGKKD